MSRRAEVLAEMGIAPLWRLRSKVVTNESSSSHDGWIPLKAAVSGCTKCGLHKTRTQTVFGVGDENADWMLIGEAPGAEEDRLGDPFVGQAGRLLDNMLAAIGLSRRENVYIANVLKCRPPGNRNPAPEEVEQCSPHLLKQIELIKPKLIVTLGRYSLAWFFPRDSISKVHGHLRRQNGTYFLHMYHPAAALHAGNLRKTIEDDFRKIPQALAKIGQAEQPALVAEAATEQMRLF